MPLPQTEVSISLAGEQIFSRQLPPGDYVIGSADDADIHFAAADLAPKHARLIIGARDNIVQDLGSSSGTFVAGERVRNVRVVPEAQQIQIAGSSISLRRILESAPTIGDSALSGPTVSLIRVVENGGSP
ncbi:MAG TPA: FHA domain-containing protein, partial [Chthoniobacteraceae bacterium]